MKVLRLDIYISLGLGYFAREEQLKQVRKLCFLKKQTVKLSPGLVRENITVCWSVRDQTDFTDAVYEKRGGLLG